MDRMISVNRSLTRLLVTMMTVFIVFSIIHLGGAEQGRMASCKKHFGSPTFINETEMQTRTPPLLLSFPGSGNTWVRLLVEYATGFFTGSMDVNDAELMSQMKGERNCGQRVVVIKGHPLDVLWEKQNMTCGLYGCRKDEIPRDQIRFMNRKQRRKCQKGLIYYFERVIFVVRDPWRAMFADYQRNISGSHVGIAAFNKELFTENVMAAALSYSTKWTTLISPLLHTMRPENNVTIIRYEDLIDQKVRLQRLDQIVKFLHFAPAKDRLRCAYSLGEKPDIAHRVKNTSVFNATMAYRALSPTTKCTVWALLRPFMNYFSYPMLEGMSCSGSD
jgi:hypothetical protein